MVLTSFAAFDAKGDIGLGILACFMNPAVNPEGYGPNRIKSSSIT